MHNSVQLRGDGIVYILQVGDQTYDSIMALHKQVLDLTAGIQNARILVDNSAVSRVDMGARRAGLTVARELRYQKMAFVGASPYMAELINAIALAAGKRKTIHFAKDEAEAVAWLTKPSKK